jgi:hypothetical protein
MAERLGIPAILASPLPGFTPPPPSLARFCLSPPWVLSTGQATSLGCEAGRRSSAARCASGARAPWGCLAGAPGPRPSRSMPIAGTCCRSPPTGTRTSWCQATGSWTMRVTGQPPEALASFLAAGGQACLRRLRQHARGSIPRRLAELVIEGLARQASAVSWPTRRRRLDPDGMPDHVHFIDMPPHDRLVPPCERGHAPWRRRHDGRLVRAGLPTIICPFFGISHSGPDRWKRLGVGPPPLDRRKLDVAAPGSCFQGR